MTKHNDSTISLLDAVDKIFDTATSYCDGYSYTSFGSSIDDSIFTYRWIWPNIVTNIPKIDIPNYPVSNGWLMEDGSMFLEIACTGIPKGSVEITAEDNVLSISTTHGRYCTGWKELFHNLKIKPFEWKSRISSKYDLTKLEAVMADGLLTVTIPLKEAAKPVKKSFEIK